MKSTGIEGLVFKCFLRMLVLLLLLTCVDLLLIHTCLVRTMPEHFQQLGPLHMWGKLGIVVLTSETGFGICAFRSNTQRRCATVMCADTFVVSRRHHLQTGCFFGGRVIHRSISGICYLMLIAVAACVTLCPGG